MPLDSNSIGAGCELDWLWSGCAGGIAGLEAAGAGAGAELSLDDVPGAGWPGLDGVGAL